MTKLALTACLLLSSATFYTGLAHSSELPHLKVGEDYTSVRTKMLKAGWKPFHAKDADHCSESGRCAPKRPEMYTCAGTGAGECMFLWKKKGKIIGVCTVDDPPQYYKKCEYP